MDSDPKILKSKLNYNKYRYNAIIELLFEKLKTDSDKTCLIDCCSGKKWTKKQVLDSSLNFANYLINELRLKKGEIVCFIANNSDIHAIGIIGVLAAGLIFSSIPEHSTEREIKEMVADIKPSILVGIESNFQMICDIKTDFSSIKNVLILNRNTKPLVTEEICISVEMIFNIEKQSNDVLPRCGGLNDYATIVMSSGSTGRPKAILRTNSNLLTIVSILEHKELCPLTSDDIFISSGFCHLSGQRSLFSCINSGAQLAIIEIDENHEDTFKNINKFKVTCAFLVPTQLNFLLKNYEKFDNKYLESIRDLRTGGSHLSGFTYNSIVEKYNFEKFRNFYGSSELGTATMVYFTDSKQLKEVESVGKLCPGVELKVIDEKGNSLKSNMHGQLCFRGDQITPGYLNNDEENAKLYTSDGFLKTGDFGYYDDNEFIYVLARIKEIIIVEGVVVSPSELERVLLENDQVINAAVIGVKDQYYDEIPMAFVILTNGSKITEKELEEWFDSRVNYYKKLRGGVKFINKFPLTPLKKINKPELKKMIPQFLRI